MSAFTLLNAIALLASLRLIYITVKHYRFFKRSDKSMLAKKLKHAFFADFLSAISIATYASTNVFQLDFAIFWEAQEWRYALKTFQIFTILYNVWAMSGLHVFIANKTNNEGE